MADEPAGRAWARTKFDWLDRVADDLAGRHLVFCVAHALLRDTDKATGITGIAQREIAEKIVASLRSVQLAIDKLESVGFLTVIKPKGPRLGNRYRLHLPPEPFKDSSLAQPSALKSDPSLAQPTTLNEASLAHPDSIFSAAQCAPYPRSSPVKDHPRQGATASPTPTRAIGEDEEDGLLDQIRQAIEAAGKKLAKRKKPHNLDGIRNLIATGIPRDLAVSVVAAVALKLSAPLGNLDAEFLLQEIRDRAAADGYGSTAPVSAKPDDGSRLVGGLWRTRQEIEAATRRWCADGTWNFDLGLPPDDPAFELGKRYLRSKFPDGYETLADVEAQVASWHAGRAWNESRFGFAPDSEFTDVPFKLRGPRRGDVALSVARTAAPPAKPELEPETATKLRNGTVRIGLDRILRNLGAFLQDDDQWGRVMVEQFGALPSPFDAEDCTLPLEWQVKALEYRNEKM